ncbi:MAG: hypothetical protein LKF38_06925 [Bifidobacterium sp.]|nr:hypothetical protein [Bifidobacterium sp.]
MKTSTSTPNAKAKPMDLIIAESLPANPLNTVIMMIAAAVTTDRPALNPRITEALASVP